MTEPVSPEQAQAAVEDQLAPQAASVAPDTSSIDAIASSGAQPAEVDAAALLEHLQEQAARLEALRAQVEAQAPKPEVPPPPARLADTIAPNASRWLADILDGLESRIEALEGK